MIRSVTQFLADLLGTNAATTVVVINEVDSSGVSEDAKGAPAPAK